RPPRRSASNCRRHCLRALMILSNDRILLHCMSPEVAQSGHTSRVARCPLSGANRKTFTRSELTASEPAADDRGVEAHPALLERQDCTLAACYRSLYAPRTGGAYDSHHRTTGIAGCTGRRGSRVAARGAGAAAGDAGGWIYQWG